MTGNAFNRQTQLSLAASHTKLNPENGEERQGMMCATGGLYAPTIRHHLGVFYVICTNVIHADRASGTSDRHQNFILSSTDIWNNRWSDPVFFDFDGIDTSLFWDQDGRSYMHGSAAPGPMTTIKIFEIDDTTGQKLSDEKVIWKGTGGIWPEGPHIYRNNDEWYYLVISEGGTFEDHMITVARSRSIWGPYEANPRNPILTARGTDEYVQHTGHSDFFQDVHGRWWAVCLGVRKDQSSRYIMGRETFLTPVTWKTGDWPTVAQVRIGFPSGLMSGNFAFNNSQVPFLAKEGADWCYLRNADLSCHKMLNHGQEIRLLAGDSDLSDAKTNSQVTFVGKRQRRLEGYSQVSIQNISTSTQSNAGLCIYKDEHRFARVFIEAGASSNEVVFEVTNKAKSIHRTKRSAEKYPAVNVSEIKLKVEYTERSYRFYYQSQHENGWVGFPELDTEDLTGHDFVGPIVGIFAFSKESGSSTEVTFRDLIVQ